MQGWVFFNRVLSMFIVTVSNRLLIDALNLIHNGAINLIHDDSAT